MIKLSNEEYEKTIKRYRKQAEEYLINYVYLDNKYKCAKYEALNGDKPAEVVGHGSMPGHPTEAAAIRSAEYDAKHDEYYWLYAVGILLSKINDNKLEFIKYRREADRANKKAVGHPAWVTYVQARYSDYMAVIKDRDDLFLSERTIRRIWRTLINRVVYIYLFSKIK